MRLGQVGSDGESGTVGGDGAVAVARRPQRDAEIDRGRWIGGSERTGGPEGTDRRVGLAPLQPQPAELGECGTGDPRGGRGDAPSQQRFGLPGPAFSQERPPPAQELVRRLGAGRSHGRRLSGACGVSPWPAR